MSWADDGPKKLGSAIEEMLRHMNAPSADVLRAVFVRWPEVVGEEVAAHARPDTIDGTTLVVVADDPTWASQLHWLENQLIERIRRVSGSDRVEAVKVRVARQGEGPSR